MSEVLNQTFRELEEAMQGRKDPSFWRICRPDVDSPADRPLVTPQTSPPFGGAQIYISASLNHTGAHKANNVMGQGLLVKRMGKKRVIAETGAGQHGMATATMAAKFGFACTIYMGEVDVRRQRPNVFWMEKMGATVVPVKDGSRTLKDAINEAFRDWVTNLDDTHYVFGTACGPAPFCEWSAGSSRSAGGGMADRRATRQIAGPGLRRVGGGSNAMGVFRDSSSRWT
jgi:tryptophan synthase beta chain